MVIRYMGAGMLRNMALQITSITRHQFYSKPKSARRAGKPRSTHTKKIEKLGSAMIENEVVLDEMLRIERDPDLRCGSLRMTKQLQLNGFVINNKKVYPMMKQLGLIKANKRKGKSSGRNFVKYRIVNPTRPLMVLEMDIKLFWIVKDRRNAYVITVIDTFTREVLGHLKGYTMKAVRVKELWDRIIEQHLEPAGMAMSDIQIEIRNDNGPQFIAMFIREYFLENGLKQVFTNPYTPQENGHIESFHGIMSNCVGTEFFNFHELEERLDRFYNTYNNERAHLSTKGLPPLTFRRAWENDLVITCHDPKKPTLIKLRHPLYEIPGILSQREHLATEIKRAKRILLKKLSGEITSSAHYDRTPVYTSPSVASCVANEVDKTLIY